MIFDSRWLVGRRRPRWGAHPNQVLSHPLAGVPHRASVLPHSLAGAHPNQVLPHPLAGVPHRASVLPHLLAAPRRVLALLLPLVAAASERRRVGGLASDHLPQVGLASAYRQGQEVLRQAQITVHLSTRRRP